MRPLHTSVFCAAIASLCLQPAVATGSAPVAYVYVATSKGVFLYDAASTGKLTLVGGPYAVSGLAIGSNGKYFVSVGTDYIHTYAIASNGAIGKQAAQINTQLYSGADCGTTSGGVLDHTGLDIYVSLHDATDGEGDGVCEAFQTFKIDASTGSMTFLGTTVFEEGDRFAGTDTLPALTGNGTGVDVEEVPQSSDHMFNVFTRESSGTLNFVGQSFSAPQAQAGSYFYPLIAAGGLTNQLAVATSAEQDPPDGAFGPVQLASYTVNSQGMLASTNTWQDMPAPITGVAVMNMSPSGQLLAVGGSGLLVYHFNGAAPITPYSARLTPAGISEIHWDNANHLYALSSNKLYVFTVTPTSITPVSGSPFSVVNGSGLFVVPR